MTLGIPLSRDNQPIQSRVSCLSADRRVAVQDLGFDLLPELGQQNEWVSELIFSSMLISFVLWTFSPFWQESGKRFYTAVLYARVLMVLVSTSPPPSQPSPCLSSVSALLHACSATKTLSSACQNWCTGCRGSRFRSQGVTSGCHRSISYLTALPPSCLHLVADEIWKRLRLLWARECRCKWFACLQSASRCG